MAHSNWLVLESLLKALDDDRVDIYLHIDRKAKGFDLDLDQLYAVPRKATIKIYSKYKVFWGGYSQIKTEMFLLTRAAKTHHDYYHLLSGQDCLLKSIDEIDSFFENRSGEEFIYYTLNEQIRKINKRHTLCDIM